VYHVPHDVSRPVDRRRQGVGVGFERVTYSHTAASRRLCINPLPPAPLPARAK
jgi:hypothetical protein